jgi:endonuclease III
MVRIIRTKSELKTKAAPPPPPAPELKKRARRALALLRKWRPDAKIELEYSNPLELVVATILSAQATDVGVNRVTRTLFRKYRTAAAYASADLKVLEQEIKSTGFYHNKSKALVGLGQKLVMDFDGKVPDTMAALLTLPGVARKTANVVLGSAFQKAEGIVVDTHILRVAYRLGLTTEKTAEKIERDLMALYPRKDWIDVSTLLVLHGRYVCIAKLPRCSACGLNKLCPRLGVTKSQ